jgi:phage/plasmid primase-like uncharacterized protein
MTKPLLILAMDDVTLANTLSLGLASDYDVYISHSFAQAYVKSEETKPHALIARLDVPDAFLGVPALQKAMPDVPIIVICDSDQDYDLCAKNGVRATLGIANAVPEVVKEAVSQARARREKVSFDSVQQSLAESVKLTETVMAKERKP